MIADHYSATAQAVREAIRQSVMQDETVHVSCLSASTYEAVCAQLWDECEAHDPSASGSDHASVKEYWGINLDREEWRVHVSGPSGVEA